nr:DUF2190 family protein [Rhodovulum sp. BSW8]
MTAVAAASSGDGVNLGNLFGIASGDAAIGDPLVLVTEGVFEMPKVPTDELAVGDAVFFRTSDGTVTSAASGSTKIGVAVSAAGMPQPVKRMSRRLREPVGPKILVDRGREAGGAGAVFGEAVGALRQSLQAHARQGDDAACVARLELASNGLNRNVRCGRAKPYLIACEGRQLARPRPGVDHRQKDAAGFLVEPVQRPGGQELVAYPAFGEGRALLCLTFLETEIGEGQHQPEPLHAVHGLQHVAKVDKVFVARIGRKVFALDAFKPPLAKVQHIVAGNVANGLVAYHVHEVLHGFLARVFPASELVRAFAKRLVRDQAPIEFQRPSHCYRRFTHSAHKGSRVPHIQFTVFALFDGFDTCKELVLRQLGDLGRWQVAEGPDGSEILGCLETLFCVAGVTGKPGFPALNDVLPRDRGFLLRDGKGVRVQADPDALALFHALIAARHALAQVVSAAPLHDGHGRFPAGGVCGLRGEMCCKTR